jgi:hypothetical protein
LLAIIALSLCAAWFVDHRAIAVQNAELLEGTKRRERALQHIEEALKDGAGFDREQMASWLDHEDKTRWQLEEKWRH